MGGVFLVGSVKLKGFLIVWLEKVGVKGWMVKKGISMRNLGLGGSLVGRESYIVLSMRMGGSIVGKDLEIRFIDRVMVEVV